MPPSAYNRVLRHQGMLRLVTDDALVELIRDVVLENPSFLCHVLAETMQRAWLRGGTPGGSQSIERFQSVWVEAGGIPGQLAESLASWCASQQRSRSFDLETPWPHDESCGDLRAEFERLLVCWRDAHGVIAFAKETADPFVLPAVALPFTLNLGLTMAPRHPRFVVNGLGDEWSPHLDDAVRVALGVAEKSTWTKKPRGVPQLEFCTLRGPCEAEQVEMKGRSACLPILAALCFGAHGRRASVFDIAFSGAITPHGTLEPISGGSHLWDAKRCALESIGIRQVIMPGDWPANDEVAGRIAELLRRLPSPLMHQPPAELGKEIGEIRHGMRDGTWAASDAKRRLVEILDGPLAAPGIRLRALRPEAVLLLASADCHLGNPKAARAHIDKLTTELGSRPTLILSLAKVRLAVIETDLGLYDSASALCQEALENCPFLPDDHHRVCNELDLRMRAEGTRGQALSFKALIPRQDQHRNEALACLRRSLCHARDLTSDPPDLPPHDLDVPRSLVGIFLWHALHAPESAAEAWSEAWNASSKCPGSRQYLLRHLRLARYRALLLGRTIPWWPNPEPSLPDKHASGGWLYHTALKYQATWRAIEGDIEGSRQDFAIAAELVKKPEPLIRFIGATAALQAAESLAVHDAESSKAFLSQARDVFSNCQTWFSGVVSGGAWLARTEALMNNLVPSTHPQLCYPY